MRAFAHIEERAPTPVTDPKPEELRKSRAQVEELLTNIKNAIEGISREGDTTEDKDLQDIQNQTRILEEFLKVGERVDSYLRSSSTEQPVDEEEEHRHQASDNAGCPKFYKELELIAKAIANSVNTWKANLHTDENKPIDSRDAISTDSGNTALHGV